MSTATTSQTIRDIILPTEEIPVMPPHTLMKEALEMMSEKRLGLA